MWIVEDTIDNAVKLRVDARFGSFPLPALLLALDLRAQFIADFAGDGERQKFPRDAQDFVVGRASAPHRIRRTRGQAVTDSATWRGGDGRLAEMGSRVSLWEGEYVDR